MGKSRLKNLAKLKFKIRKNQMMTGLSKNLNKPSNMDLNM